MASFTAHELEQVNKLIAEHGSVPPPFWAIKDVLPSSICWRMGGGEDFACFFSKWWHLQELTEAQKIAYFRQWVPPHAWLEWMIEHLWGELPISGPARSAALHKRFERSAALGFGSQEDFFLDESNPKYEESYD